MVGCGYIFMNVYIVETPILGLMNPRENAALYNGLDHPFPTEYQNLKVFCCIIFPNLDFYEMTLGIPGFSICSIP